MPTRQGTAGLPNEHEVDAVEIDAVIFDLDGVITRTESVHHAAWEQLLNVYLLNRSALLE